MNQTTLNYYKKFRKHSPFMLVGWNAALALKSAKKLVRFQELEAEGLVRIRAEEENEHPFDVFGEPDSEKERKEQIAIFERLGVWWTVSEYFDGQEWQQADSCGMHTGYQDVLSPFENCYIIDHMAAAIREADKVALEPSEAFNAACRDIATVTA